MTAKLAITYSEAEKAILQNGLVFEQAKAGLAEQLAGFGLTNEKAGEIISQFYLSLTGTTIAAAIELAFKYREDARQELLVKSELETKNIELELRKRELAIKEKELEYAERKLVAETKAIEWEAKIQEQKLLLEKQKLDLEKAKILVTKAQEALIARQTTGYDDQLLIKVAEFESGVASNAVNSAPDNASTQDTITKFNTTVDTLKERVK